jgi:Co/Zn/Cd efflux system component
MKHLSDLQHSLIRFAITVLLYAMYCWLIFEAIELYFHPELTWVVIALFVATAGFTMLFMKVMPKRRRLLVAVEVN